MWQATGVSSHAQRGTNMIQCDATVVEMVVLQSVICTVLSRGLSWEDIYREFRESVTADVISEFETGRMNVEDVPRSGRRAISNTQKNAQRVSDVICADQRKKLQETSTELWISHAIIFNIVRYVIQYWEASKPWVPNSSTILRSWPDILKRVHHSWTGYLQAMNLGLTTTLQHRGKHA
jgi:hypothetical protein